MSKNDGLEKPTFIYSDRLNVLAKANVTNSTIIEQDEW